MTAIKLSIINFPLHSHKSHKCKKSMNNDDRHEWMLISHIIAHTAERRI